MVAQPVQSQPTTPANVAWLRQELARLQYERVPRLEYRLREIL